MKAAFTSRPMLLCSQMIINYIYLLIQSHRHTRQFTNTALGRSLVQDLTPKVSRSSRDKWELRAAGHQEQTLFPRMQPAPQIIHVPLTGLGWGISPWATHTLHNLAGYSSWGEAKQGGAMGQHLGYSRLSHGDAARSLHWHTPS